MTLNKIVAAALQSPMAKFYLALVTLAIAALIATLVYAAFSDYRPFAARAHDPPTQGRETRLYDGGSAHAGNVNSQMGFRITTGQGCPAISGMPIQAVVRSLAATVTLIWLDLRALTKCKADESNKADQSEKRFYPIREHGPLFG